MSKPVLKMVSDAMDALGINYELKKWTGEIVYPYFVGEYQETPSPNEDGLIDTGFILSGFARGATATDELLNAKEKIQAYFPSVGGRRAITDNSAVAIFYAGCYDNLPTGDAELEKIQINLDVKEWRVI